MKIRLIFKGSSQITEDEFASWMATKDIELTEEQEKSLLDWPEYKHHRGILTCAEIIDPASKEQTQ